MTKISKINRVLKDGTLRVTEYELRLINSDGDAVDVMHGDTPEEAKSHGSIGGDIVATVLEKHISYHPAWRTPRGQEPDKYITIETTGDRAALEAGGWLA